MGVTTTDAAFADFTGNRQYISAGNLSENDQVSLFLMDYPNRRRIKIWGRARVIDDDKSLLEELTDEAYGARPERAIAIKVDAWDINCPQHITPRYSESELGARLNVLHERIAELEVQIESNAQQ